MYVFKMLRRTVLALIASVFTLATQAQTYPNKPIRLVGPFAAGGSSDVLARLLAKEVEVSLAKHGYSPYFLNLFFHHPEVTRWTRAGTWPGGGVSGASAAMVAQILT